MSAVPQVIPQLPVAQPTSDASALMQIINRAATDPSFDVAKLEQLLAVKERWDATEARKAFVGAMAAFKADPPTLTKNKHVKFGNTEYDHATLDHASEAIGAALTKHGLSHRWEVEQGERIKVSCILTHILGHSERVTMEAAPDTSGSKNSIQAIGSTVTYLQRYTLLAATGMAVKGQDNDGAGARGMEEGKVADHLAAIESAGEEAALKKAFASAYKAAQAAKDQGAERRFIKAKDDRRRSLGGKA